jgi:hypothetical protein
VVHRDEAATTAVSPEPPAEPTPPARSARSRPTKADPTAVPDGAWAGAELDPAVAERGLRGLVGGGSSQVSPQAAMRARDAARPRPEDLARAEAELQIVRRYWTPRD